MDILTSNNLDDSGAMWVCNTETDLYVILESFYGFAGGEEQIKMEIKSQGVEIGLKSGQYRFKGTTNAE